MLYLRVLVGCQGYGNRSTDLGMQGCQTLNPMPLPSRPEEIEGSYSPGIGGTGATVGGYLELIIHACET